MSWLNLENVKATKRRLFSASGTRHPERKWCRMNSAVCLCVCIDPTVTTNPPVLLRQHVLSFQPECVCIFQHDWHLCESNPCSTTLTRWTLLIQVYCHSFLAAPIGSDLPPFRVKRDANRKSFSENGRTSWMWQQWTSLSCVVNHWSDSNLWWLWFRYHDRLIDKTIRYIKQLSDNLTPQLSSTPDACVCLGSGPAQWHSVTALQQRCSEVWPADSNFVWLKSFVFPGTIIKTLRKHFNNLDFNSKFCYILYIPNKTLTVK